jgi:hypothetical protein
MSGVINIPQSEPWFAAGWAFRKVLERAMLVSGDSEGQQVLKQAIALNGLHFGFLSNDQALRLARILIIAANELRLELIAEKVEPRDQQLADSLITLVELLAKSYGLAR